MAKYFLDCGAWNGFSARFFYDNHPDAKEFKIHSFECNPKLFDEIRGRCGDIENFHLENSAVWIEDGFIDLYLGEGKFVESSSLIKEKRTGNLDKENPSSVPCVDFSRWLKDNVTSSDQVYCKMNIEGAEYEVLEKMIKDGTLDLVDNLYVQWHWKKINLTKKRHNSLVRKLEDSNVRLFSWPLDHDAELNIINKKFYKYFQDSLL